MKLYACVWSGRYGLSHQSDEMDFRQNTVLKVVKSCLDFGALIIRLRFSLVFQETHNYVASWKNVADSTSGGLSLLLHQGNTYSTCRSTCSQQNQCTAFIWLRADALCTDLQSLLIFLTWRYLEISKVVLEE